MGFEYIGSLPNPDAQTQDALPRQSLATSDEQTQPRRQKQVTDSNSNTVEPSYREHSSNSASLPPLETLSFYPPRLPYQQEQSTQQQLPGPPYPAWQSHQSPVASQPSAPPQQQPYPATPIPPYAGWQFYQPPPAAQPPAQPQQQPYPAMSAPSYPFAGYPPGIQYPYGYNGYGYPQVPPSAYPGYEGFWSPHSPYLYPQLSQMPQPRRDSYQFTVAIISTICSGLVMLAGFFCGFTLLSFIVASPNLSYVGTNAGFSASVMYTVLTIIGLAGGGSSLYHSIRALLQKQSAPFKLPWFGLFLIFYAILLATGFTVGTAPQVLANEPLRIFLIVLAGIFPALTFLALAVRRLHYAQQAPWNTTWRRLTLAIVSGGTLTILLAMIFEVVLTQLVGTAFGVHTSIIDNLNMRMPHNVQELVFLLVLASVIAPIIEECVKPLAVAVMIGRLHSAAEAFILGFACGIGFDLIETTGYISLGDPHLWINTALERSTAGLLHAFGAGMVALGCYYLTHRNSINNRTLIGLGCIAYAIIQHSVWNGTFLFALLPAPVGPFVENGTVQIGSYTMQGLVVAYLVESLLIFAFFLFVTGKLRRQQAPKATRQGNQTGLRAVNTPASFLPQ